MAINEALDAIIWQVVATIPRGRVTTYGAIAKMAGYPSHARYVGRVLKQLPKDTSLPWHRVVNAKGELSFPEGGHQYMRQKKRLEAEGIVFRGSRLLLSQYSWSG